MSLLEKLQKLYHDNLEIEAKKKLEFDNRVRKEAQIWIDGVMTPLLIKNAQLGQLKIRDESWMLEPEESPIYYEEIERIGIKILEFSPLFVTVSWLEVDSDDPLIPL